MRKSERLHIQITEAQVSLEKSYSAMIKFIRLADDDYARKLETDLTVAYNALEGMLDEAAYEIIAPIQMDEDERDAEIARLEARILELRTA